VTGLDFLTAILAGIIQGVLEWLPISSEAFLFIFFSLMGVSPLESFIFAIMMHLPTGIAAFLFYREEYGRIFRGLINRQMDPLFKRLNYILIGTAITGIPIYFVYHHMLETLSSTIQYSTYLVFLIIGATMLLVGLWSRGILREGKKKIEDMTVKDCVFVGLIQGFSILPGVTRSGSTLAALLSRKLNEESSINFTFIIAAPVSILVFIFEFLVSDINFNLIIESGILISFLSAFVVSIFIIKLLVSFAKKFSYSDFLIFMGMIIILANIAFILF